MRAARSSGMRGSARAGRRSTIRLRDGVAALRDDGEAQPATWRGARADTGDLAGAIAAHEAALARDPPLAQAHANLISLYGRAGQFAKAEEHYRTAVALGQTLARRTTITACCSACRRSGIAAADAYRRALAVNASHVQARNNLGQLLERQRQFEAAAAEYRLAVEGQPVVPSGAVQPRAHAPGPWPQRRGRGRADQADRSARR